MTWINWGCGTHLAPKPWINTDVLECWNTHPDVIIDPNDPFVKWDHGSVERIFAGHIFEHIPWPTVPQALARVREALAPNGEMLVVGPDAWKVVEAYKQGLVSQELVRSVLEHDHDTDFRAGEWPEAQHHWNCHEARMNAALLKCGFTTQVLSAPPADWPVVGWSEHWQFAILVRA